MSLFKNNINFVTIKFKISKKKTDIALLSYHDINLCLSSFFFYNSYNFIECKNKNNIYFRKSCGSYDGTRRHVGW